MFSNEDQAQIDDQAPNNYYYESESEVSSDCSSVSGTSSDEEDEDEIELKVSAQNEKPVAVIEECESINSSSTDEELFVETATEKTESCVDHLSLILQNLNRPTG